MAKQITDFEFRPINQQLVDKVQQFHYHLFGADNDGFFGNYFLQSLLECTAFRSLLLFEKNKSDIVAVSCFQTYGYIWSFGVHSNYRRLGLGKFILKCTIECMIDMKCIEASLNVNTQNEAAIKLYKSGGFHINYNNIESLKDFYGSNDPIGPDAYGMQMMLPSEKSKKHGYRQAWKTFTAKEWNLVHRINALLIAIDSPVSSKSKLF
eukprot:253416_1